MSYTEAIHMSGQVVSPTMNRFHSDLGKPLVYASLGTGKLKDVDETYYYGAQCKQCNHMRRLNLRKLREHLGGEFALALIRERLKCDLCGSRSAIITFLTPAHRTGSLVHLFCAVEE